MRRVGTSHTIQLIRTIEIEVDITAYPEYGEIELQTAINCSTGNSIDLTDDEIDHINETALSEFVQGLADAEADAKEDERKLDEYDER